MNRHKIQNRFKVYLEKAIETNHGCNLQAATLQHFL